MEFSDVFKNYLNSGTANKSESSDGSSKEAAIGPVAPYQTSIFQRDKDSIKYAIGPISSRITDRMTVGNKRKDREDNLAFFQNDSNNRSWLNKGLLSDGVDEDDIWKIVLASLDDVGEDLLTGAVGIVEGVADAGAMIAPVLLGTDKEKATEFVAKDFIDEQSVVRELLSNLKGLQQQNIFAQIDGKGYVSDEELKSAESLMKEYRQYMDERMEDESIVGDKLDSLAQSTGQMLATSAASMVGVPWWLITGATAGAGEAESALKEGATYEQALDSGIISGAAEVLSEKLFSGIKFGGKALDDALVTALSRGVSNKFARNALKLGLDVTGEGLEEVVTSLASEFGQWLTYRNDESLKEIIFSEQALDEKIEAFFSGALMGGGSSASNLVTSKFSGVDATSGLSANEEKVINKLYKDRVAEAEKDGKITAKEKNKIYDEVVEAMDKGEIAVDDIERILGGESYKTYKDTVASEDATLKQYKDLTREYRTLNDMDIEQMSDEQLARQNELRKQIKGMQKQVDDIKNNSQRESMRTKLSEDVFGLVKGSRLTESYNEQARRGQFFKADVSKYDEKQRATVQNAIDSGVLNNTNRSHQFVDMVAKIAADKGVAFDFTNNKKLKDSGFAIEGKEVNGFVTKDGVTLNMDSKKALNFTVGHEITHVLEGTELYTEMQKAVFAYAESKGELGSRWSKLKETYKGIDGADVNAELTADLVGDYLFGDEGFIRNLSTGNRNVFQKIYDEIKYLCKVATAGSKEAKELERIKHLFEEAYRAEGKSQTGTKYSLSEDGHPVTKDMDGEVTFSLSNDTDYMDKAISQNEAMKRVDSDVMTAAKDVRKRIADRITAIKDKGLVGLPEDIEGNTYIANSSYDGTEENATICPRSLASEAFVDAVSEYLGRPLTVEEQIYISQDLQGRSLTPECTYCYVATDRKAYRAFLGEYVKQRDSVLKKIKSNPDADLSRKGDLYKEFLNGRKDTNAMYNRFKMWADAYQKGTPMIDASHLANINKLMGDINSEFGEELKPQIVDAMKYAQSASWAKKRINYVAYNGHILKWKQDRINKLNSHYGLRMYSFSDFHPAFVLENMQMITDASVRGLKMLGYTKDTDFVEIFAPSGMNINISTFGFETGGNVFENNIIGAEWQKAQDLRQQYPNVGITFIATNDNLVRWALQQDWIDVVIPFHLVRTGKEVAKAFNYHDYTSESSDLKTKDWKKGDKKYIAPTDHNNDKDTYLAELEKNHLKPRFERFVGDPNYMKLVNECRQPASDSKPVQPVFNEDAAMKSLSKLETNGYYQPIGGSVDRMYEIAGEVAEAMEKEIAPTQYSLSEAGEEFTKYGDYNVYGSDIGIAPTPLKTNLSHNAVGLIRFATEGELTWGKARQIVDRPEYKEAFEEVTGITLEGSRSEQKRIVMGVAEELRRYEGTVQMEDMAPIGDIDRVRPPKPKVSMTIQDDEQFQPLLEVMTDGKMTFAGAKTIANSGALRQAFESLYGITLPKTNTKAVPHILSLAEDVESMADAYEATQNIVPIAPKAEIDAPIVEITAPVAETVDLAPVNKSTKNTPQSRVFAPIAVKQKKQGMMSKLVNRLVDKGMVFENVALNSGNMELQAKWDYALPSKAEARAQYFMRNGKNGTPSLDSVRKRVEKSGKTEAFEDYMWHWRNVDSMTLSERFGVDDKPVFGTSVTADISRKKIAHYEKNNPEFKDFAKDLYSYMAEERRMMVESGLITEEQAKHMEAMYPHYIPLHREMEKMLGPVQGMDLGVNSPIKSATGGNRPLQPMFDTIAQHTIQTFKAAARNDFGVELKNTIQTSAKIEATNADEILDSIDNQGNLLGAGNYGHTFSVYENGQRVTFGITEEMHDALKPTEGILAKRIKPLTAVSNLRRNLITTWNPVFALYRNPAKDIQDVMINSQHPVKTYKNVPKAAWQLLSSGEWATEYLENGGEQNTYYDNRKSEFTMEESVFKKLIGMPVRGLEAAGEFFERIPRLAEYIASREEGRSIQRSMLDAARVTTNFAAGGDFTKFLNSHGFTFLNAGVQGTSQFVRNFREAKLNGLKGWVQLAAKFTVAGLADDLLNGLFWDEEEDEDYEALSDHVKQNYYVIAKTQDGKFVRFPKGRVAAVIQDAMEQMEHLVTGDDEADFESFFKLVMDNLAPGNPLDNNIIAPINQALVNKTWYDDNLVPTRLAKLPAAEQFDESTDSISKWLGEKMDISPYKINYLIDQYSGGLGDFALPMLTPKAESDDDSLLGHAIAPWKKEFTVDSVLNNKATGDFYETLEAAEAQAESKDATPEDKLKSSFLISYNVEISKLMQEQRAIQTSDLPDSEKYKRNREIKEEINALQKEALESLKDNHIDGIYAEVGDKRFNYSEEDDTWWEVKPQLANGEDNWYYTQEQLFHDNLGVSYADFWNGRLDPDKYEVTSLYDEVGEKRYNFDMEENAWFEIKPKKADGTDNPYYQNEQQALKAFGISSEEYWNNRDMYDDLTYVGFGYDKNDTYDDSIQTTKNVFGYKKFAEYASVLKTLKADKDSNGNSISGTKKKKVKEYVYSLNIPEIYKHILFKSQYKNDRSHNREIATYIGESTGMTYRQKLDVLNELGYKVDDKGNIRW